MKGNRKSLQGQAPSLREGGSALGASSLRRPPPHCKRGFLSTLHRPPPSRQTFIQGRPGSLPFSVGPPNAPTVPEAHRFPPPIFLPTSLPQSTGVGGPPAGDRGREDTQRARKAAFVHRPQQLTLVTRSAMASSSPGSSSVRRSGAREPPTSRGPGPTTDQQPFLRSSVPPFLRSTPGGAGPGLRFKPRTAPSLLVCSWHSLPSHWLLPVPPRMRFLGDPAETFESGRGQPLALRQLCCHLQRRAGGARPTCGGELVRRGS